MHILIVEDNEATLRLLEKKLGEWNHTVELAKNGAEAWEKLISVPVDIIITDWIMPEMNGLELCARIRKTDFKHYIYLIIITAQDTREHTLQGLEAGADDYIIKPINLQELQARIEIGARIVRLEKELKSRLNMMKGNYLQTIHMFTNLIEVFNKELGGHCRRVGNLSLELARRHPEVSEEDYLVIEAAGLLHDIGMVGLPDEICSKKKTEMTGDEIRQYRSHPISGELILKEIEFLRPIATLVRAHHEQFNGRGFPDGLKGHEIPLLARILSAASVYDNIIHRGKIALEDIPEKLHSMQGYQLEPAMVDDLLKINLEYIQENKKKDSFVVSLDELQEGMALAKDVRMNTGALVMPSRTELTGKGIEKLKSYYKQACIVDKVSVLKHSFRG